LPRANVLGGILIKLLAGISKAITTAVVPNVGADAILKNSTKATAAVLFVNVNP